MSDTDERRTNLGRQARDERQGNQLGRRHSDVADTRHADKDGVTNPELDDYLIEEWDLTRTWERSDSLGRRGQGPHIPQNRRS